MAVEQVVRHAKFLTHLAYLILEEEAQRLDNLEVHALRKPAHIVVRLDGGRRPLDRCGLNHVRVDGALAQPFDIFQFLRLRIKNLNESGSYDFAFLFRIGHPFELFIEYRPGLHPDDIYPNLLA